MVNGLGSKVKAAIKREQSDACISYAEREQVRCETSKKEPEEKVPSALFGYIFRLSKSRPSKLRASNSRLQPLGTSVLIN